LQEKLEKQEGKNRFILSRNLGKIQKAKLIDPIAGRTSILNQ
jgi:hypothetical protein